MVTETFCDAVIKVNEYQGTIKRCCKPAYHNVSICHGYLVSSSNSTGTSSYSPFEHPNIKNVDLCEEHYKQWCMATYKAIIKNEKVELEQ
jgi:hypothetical protein